MKSFFKLFSVFLGLCSPSFAHDYPNPISPQEAKAQVDAAKAVLIDIREANEIAQGMAAPALSYAKSSIDSNPDAWIKYLTQFSGKEVILYCRSGHRASIIVELLAKHGIHAWNMGGYMDWVNAGFATKTPDHQSN